MPRIYAVVCIALLFGSAAAPPLFANDEPTVLKVGELAPSFVVADDSGEKWKSADHYGKKVLVIYFYPADMTGGCTAQACAYRDSLGELESEGVEIVGISGDSVENHQWFKKAHQLNFTLLADVDGVVAEKFGVPITRGEKSVNAIIEGSQRTLYRNVTPKRWTFVIDREGKIAYKNNQVQAKQDAAKILEVVKGLK